MMKNLLIIVLFIAFAYTQEYCAGDQVSSTHQNAVHLVGAGHGDYEVGDDFRLADWNGDLNGGQYHIIFIDMSASW
jgi:hypothetical protein